MSRTVSQTGLNLIAEFEGCNLTAYKCPAGVWTIGYGHTGNVKEGQTITKAEALELFRKDLQLFANHVNKFVKLPLNQNQFDALVSFTYNCGVGNLQRLIKNRTHAQIADALLLYNKANGKVLNGLVRRRKAERELFLKSVGTQKVQVTAGGLNVRTGIGTSYKIVTVLNKNQQVTISDIRDGWGKTPDGWINLKYTKNI